MSEYLERFCHTWSEDSIRLINTPSSTAKSLYFYMQEAGYFKTYYPYFTERKNLNSFLIVYTLSGHGVLNYGEQTYTIEKGQCFFINCMNHHNYETPIDSSWEFLWLHFNGPNTLGYYREFVKNDFQILQVTDTAFFENTIRDIISLYQKRTVFTDVLISNQINNLLTKLLIESAPQGQSNIFIPDYLKHVIKYIEHKFKEPLSLEQLADMESINKFHLSREFKHYTGVTVNEYIITTRLSYAKELLKYSDIPISEITFQCGMNNVSHFINLFKSRENRTPLNYRKEWNGTTE